MRLEMFVASDDATHGSVIAKHERISPSSSGCSHCSCWSGVPNWARISMLPVSGAEQFVASDEQRRRAHHLAQRRVVEVRELGAVVALGHEQVPEVALARFDLQLFHHRRREVRIARLGALVAVDGLGRPDDLVVELDERAFSSSDRALGAKSIVGSYGGCVAVKNSTSGSVSVELGLRRRERSTRPRRGRRR